MRLISIVGMLLPLAVLALGAWQMSFMGWHSFMIQAMPLLLAGLALGLVALGRTPVAGVTTAMAGVVLAATALLLSTTGDPVLGPPIAVLPVTIAATSFVALGVGALAVMQVAATDRLVGWLRHATVSIQILAPGLALYWTVIASAQGGVAIIDLLGYGVFVVVYTPIMATVVSISTTRRIQGLVLVVGAPVIAAVHALLVGQSDMFSWLTHIAAINMAGLCLALPLVLIREVLAGQRSVALVILVGSAAAAVLGRSAVEVLWLELRFSQDLDAALMLGWIALPAAAVAFLLVSRGASAARRVSGLKPVSD